MARAGASKAVLGQQRGPWSLARTGAPASTPAHQSDDARVEDIAVSREKAGKVAAWLVEKGRPDEAVSTLAA